LTTDLDSPNLDNLSFSNNSDLDDSDAGDSDRIGNNSNCDSNALHSDDDEITIDLTANPNDSNLNNNLSFNNDLNLSDLSADDLDSDEIAKYLAYRRIGKNFNRDSNALGSDDENTIDLTTNLSNDSDLGDSYAEDSDFDETTEYSAYRRIDSNSNGDGNAPNLAINLDLKEQGFEVGLQFNSIDDAEYILKRWARDSGFEIRRGRKKSGSIEMGQYLYIIS